MVSQLSLTVGSVQLTVALQSPMSVFTPGISEGVSLITGASLSLMVTVKLVAVASLLLESVAL